MLFPRNVLRDAGYGRINHKPHPGGYLEGTSVPVCRVSCEPCPPCLLRPCCRRAVWSVVASLPCHSLVTCGRGNRCLPVVVTDAVELVTVVPRGRHRACLSRSLCFASTQGLNIADDYYAWSLDRGETAITRPWTRGCSILKHTCFRALSCRQRDVLPQVVLT